MENRGADIINLEEKRKEKKESILPERELNKEEPETSGRILEFKETPEMILRNIVAKTKDFKIKLEGLEEVVSLERDLVKSNEMCVALLKEINHFLLELDILFKDVKRLNYNVQAEMRKCSADVFEIERRIMALQSKLVDKYTKEE